MRLSVLAILAVIIGGFGGAEIDPGLYQGSMYTAESNRVDILISLNLDGTFNFKRTLSSGGEIVTSGEWSVNEDTLELPPISYKTKGISPKAKHECPTSDKNLETNCHTSYFYINKNQLYALKGNERYTNALRRLEKYEVQKKGFSK